jgi:hypothetical protein
MLEERPLEGIIDQFRSLLLQELIKQLRGLLDDGPICREARRLRPQERIEISVASFDAPGLAGRRILAGANVQICEQAVPQVFGVPVVQRQRPVAFERPGKWAFVVIPVFWSSGEGEDGYGQHGKGQQG